MVGTTAEPLTGALEEAEALTTAGSGAAALSLTDEAKGLRVAEAGVGSAALTGPGDLHGAAAAARTGPGDLHRAEAGSGEGVGEVGEGEVASAAMDARGGKLRRVR